MLQTLTRTHHSIEITLCSSSNFIATASKVLGEVELEGFRVDFRRVQGFYEGLVAAYMVEEEMRKKKERDELGGSRPGRGENKRGW